MISSLLREEAPFDPAVADLLLDDVDDLAIATAMDAEGLSRLPMELQASATFIRSTVDYLMTGMDDVTLIDFVPVSPSVCTVYIPRVQSMCNGAPHKLTHENRDALSEPGIMSRLVRHGLTKLLQSETNL